jgi:hypothetical protein
LSEDKDKIEIIKYLIENKKACFDKQYLLETPSTLTKSKPSSEDKKITVTLKSKDQNAVGLLQKPRVDIWKLLRNCILVRYCKFNK